MPNSPYPQSPILIIDDEEDVLQSYRMALLLARIDNFVLCNDGTNAMSLLEKGPHSAIILDLFMPRITGQELLVKIRERYPEIPVIVVTGSNNVNTAVECMKHGAHEYMVKPVEENQLIAGLRNAVEIGELRRENLALQTRMMIAGLKAPDVFSNIITVNENMNLIFRYIEAIAASPRPVLITGESGTGKELVARAIHEASGRTGKFVAVNVGGLDDTMFSDTLFGHRKGAYTGADCERTGLIEQAVNGTLFLDEIGVLEKNSQIKLLRLLQEGEYYSLGSDIIKTTDAVVIAATNADLQTQMKEGAFRNDLYYRLNTHHIRLPALRERPNDIPVLASHFVSEAAKSLAKKCPEIAVDVLAMLRRQAFPGNVRELQSLIFDAVAQCEDPVLGSTYFQGQSAGHGKPDSSARSFSISYSGDLPRLEDVEEFFVAEALRLTNDNHTAAATLLGVSQSTISRRIKNRDS
jgi:DNA-binding NtrC family response regulator